MLEALYQPPSLRGISTAANCSGYDTDRADDHSEMFITKHVHCKRRPGWSTVSENAILEGELQSISSWCSTWATNSACLECIWCIPVHFIRLPSHRCFQGCSELHQANKLIELIWLLVRLVWFEIREFTCLSSLKASLRTSLSLRN